MSDIETYKIYIEKGIPDKHKITLFSAANDYTDAEASDIVFEVIQRPHPFFKRVNKFDLKVEVKLTLKEALLGFKKRIRHLDGHFVKIHSKSITQPNQILKIANEGLTKHDYPAERGNLIVQYDVVMPKMLLKEEMNLWRIFFTS